MNIQQNIPLKDYSTMRLGGTAAFMVEVTSRNEVKEAIEWAESRKLPVIMVGGGSNIVWKDEGFSGLLVVNKILGFEEQIEDDENYYVTVGAGEDWDSVVERTVKAGASGVEALSLIPGSTGATPVQNVGAYGQDVSKVIVSVEAYDSQTHEFVLIPQGDCSFGYRASRFKYADHGRFFITAVTFHLLRGSMQPPFYNVLQTYLDGHNITDHSPATIRDAVIAIRKSRLPDPKTVANNGSFFANPIISENIYAQIVADYPNCPSWPDGKGMLKLPAAWLIEQAGYKGFHDAETGMATWKNHPLVLVNEHAQSASQLIAFRNKIIGKVKEMFGITLEQEPELLPRDS